MPQDAINQIINVEQLAYMTLLAVQQEVGIAQRTLEQYQVLLGIEPNCLHIGTRSLAILPEVLVNVEQCKQYPVLLAHHKSSVTPQASD